MVVQFGVRVIDVIVFVIASGMVLGGALGVVLYTHPVHAALSLVLTLFGVAVHFVSMEAHFLAAVQVIVYAGAIVVLFLFVIMLLGVDTAENLRVEPIPIQRPLAAVMGLGIVGLLVAAIVTTRETKPLTVGEGLDVAGQVTSHRWRARPPRRQHPAAGPEPVQRPGVHVRADVGAADRRRRRHGRAHAPGEEAPEGSGGHRRALVDGDAVMTAALLAVEVTPTWYLLLAAVLFGIGAVGVVTRRNPLVMFMCIELMLNAVNLSFVAFSTRLGDIAGQTAVFFVLVVAAAEVVVGLGIIVSILRRRPGATADDLSALTRMMARCSEDSARSVSRCALAPRPAAGRRST